MPAPAQGRSAGSTAGLGQSLGDGVEVRSRELGRGRHGDAGRSEPVAAFLRRVALRRGGGESQLLARGAEAFVVQPEPGRGTGDEQVVPAAAEREGRGARAGHRDDLEAGRRGVVDQQRRERAAGDHQLARNGAGEVDASPGRQSPGRVRRSPRAAADGAPSSDRWSGRRIAGRAPAPLRRGGRSLRARRSRRCRRTDR